MCGITGFWDLKSRNYNLEILVSKMTDAIKQRGPDSDGIWISSQDGLALGHRRLSIVDLSPQGHQPMISSSGRSVITYNGEIFNSQEIRNELINSGLVKNKQFTSSSDTQTILEACEAWGIEATCKKLIGMFAFAIFDKKNKILSLARDRVGIKPLYWGIQNGNVFFASQPKSFFEHHDFIKQINHQSVSLYLEYGYVPEPFSIFQDIKKVQAGSIVHINNEGKLNENIYWSLEEVATRKDPSFTNFKKDDWIDYTHNLIDDSIKRRMLADVPLGAFLSGGIDSSLVVAMMQKNSATPVKTFTIGFEEDNYNEAHYAKKIAEHLKTDHYEFYLNSKQSQEIIPSIPAWCDEPFSDSSQIPTLLVSKMARQHVTVCLSGDGGDELFAGYNRYLLTHKVLKNLSYIPDIFLKIISKIIDTIPVGSLNKLSLLSKKIPPLIGDKLNKFNNLCLKSDQNDFFKNIITCWHEVKDLYKNFYPCDIFPKVPKGLSDIQGMQYIDMLTYLSGDILTKVDRASMWVSLEARVPLLDHRLIEFSWQIPDHLKIHGNSGKWLLKQVLKKYVPENLFERQKMGFGVPIDSWLRDDLNDWANDLLDKKNLQENGFDDVLVHRIWKEHNSKKFNWSNKLWNILMFQQWKKFWGL
jgi:asparagine synthase (glutamine-hydrolysing)